MSTWTITGLINGVFQTAALKDLGLQGATRSLLNLAPDRFSVTQAGYDGRALFTFDSGYLIALDGQPRFYGRRQKIRRTGAAPRDTLTYDFAGPIADLDRIKYKMFWKFGTTLKPLTKILFFVDAFGVRQNTYTVLQTVLSYAIANGAQLRLGDLSAIQAANVDPPQMLAMNPGCLEMVKKCLSYTPEMMQWIDYSSTRFVGNVLVTAPSINFSPRSSAPVVAFTDGVAPYIGADLIPRDDLVPKGWVITYVQANTAEIVAGGEEEMFIGQDVAAAPALPSGLGVQEETYELQPGSTNNSYLEQKLETVLLPPDFTDVSDSSPTTAIWWWQWKLPFLTQTDQFTLDWVEIDDPDHDLDLGLDPSGNPLKREIKTGSVQDWMLQGFGAVFHHGSVSAKLHITFTDPKTGLVHMHTIPQSIPVTTTNTALTDFKKQDGGSGETPESRPNINLAQVLYDTWSLLHHEGPINTEYVESNTVVRPGMVVNIHDPAVPEWATMIAAVQQVTEDIDNGRTSITVGPPAHLAPADLKELTTASRYSWQSGSKEKGPRSPSDAGDAKNSNPIPGAQATAATGAAAGGIVPDQMHVADPDAEGDNVISLYSDKDFLEMTILQMFRQDSYGEMRVDSDDEASVWLYNANGTVNNIKLTCKDGQIIIWDEATGLTAYLKPGGLVVTADDDQVYGEFITDGDDFSFYGYNDDGNGNQIKYSTHDGKLQVWNETSGKKTVIEPGSITLQDDSSNTRTIGTTFDEMDGADGSAWDLNGSSLTLTDASGSSATVSTTFISIDTASSGSVNIDPTAVTVTDLSGNSATLGSTFITIDSISGGSFYTDGNSAVFTGAAGVTTIAGATIDLEAFSGHEVYLDPADLHNGTFASFKAVSICNSGVNSTIDVLHD